MSLLLSLQSILFFFVLCVGAQLWPTFFFYKWPLCGRSVMANFFFLQVATVLLPPAFALNCPTPKPPKQNHWKLHCTKITENCTGLSHIFLFFTLNTLSHHCSGLMKRFHLVRKQIYTKYHCTSLPRGFLAELFICCHCLYVNIGGYLYYSL